VGRSLPLLIRRYFGVANPQIALTVGRPIRVSRGIIVKDGEIERAVRLAAYTADACSCCSMPMMIAGGASLKLLSRAQAVLLEQRLSSLSLNSRVGFLAPLFRFEAFAVSG